MLGITATTVRNLTLLLGSSLIVVASAVLAPALPGMATAFQHLPDSEFLVRLVLTVPALVAVIVAPLVGILLDRWGRKPVVVMALILFGVAGTSGYVSTSLGGILVGRIFVGLATAGVMTGLTTLIADYYSGPRLNAFMGYQGAFIGVGGLIFLALAGYLADIGWRMPFLLHLFAFIMVPGALFAVDEPEKRVQPEQQKPLDLQAPFPLKTIGPIYTLTLVGVLIIFTFVVHLPFYLTTQAGASNSQVGLALALQNVMSAVSALQYRQLRGWLSFEAIVGLSFLVFGISHVLVALTTTYSLLMVSMVFGGLGLGWLLANVNVWVALVAPPVVRGRAVSGLTAAIFLGQFITPIVTQPLVEKLGMAQMFSIVGAVSFLLAVVFAGIIITRSKERVTVG